MDSPRTYTFGRWTVDARRAEIAAVLLLALTVRLVYAALAGSIDPIIRRDPLYGDASGYHLLAVNLLKGWGLSWDGQSLTSFRMPGYPAFLAALYSLFSVDLLYVRLAQALFGAATVLPAMAIARKLSGELAAVLAGLGVALHPILVYMTGWVYTETVFILFLWTGLWLLIRALDEDRAWLAVGAGILLGLGTMARPESFALPAAALLALAILLRWPRGRLFKLLLMQVAVLAVLAPWMIRNLSVHGSFVPLTTGTGAVLFGGNNPNSDGGYFLDVPFVLPSYTEVDSNQELTGRAVEWVRENPSDFLLLLPRKVYKFFAPIEMEHSGSPLGRGTLPANLLYAVFLLTAVWGGTLGWRKNRDLTALLVVVVAWYLWIALVLYGGTRVALPIAPALMIFAATPVAEVLNRLVNYNLAETSEAL